MKCIEVKSFANGKKSVIRVRDEVAHDWVQGGEARYVPKGEWKKQQRVKRED